MSAERTPDVDNGLSAVYYARSDYASFSRRLLAAAIDASVVLALAIAINVVVKLSDLLHPVHVPVDDILLAPDLKRSETTSDLTPVFTLLLVYFAYAIVLRWSPISTVGYRICRLKILNWRGDRPDLMHLIMRAICLVVSLFTLGPIDFLWIFSGPYRLTLHDNVAQTLVVKIKAKPLGRGKVTFGIYEIILWNFTLPEIRPDD